MCCCYKRCSLSLECPPRVGVVTSCQWRDRLVPTSLPSKRKGISRGTARRSRRCATIGRNPFAAPFFRVHQCNYQVPYLTRGSWGALVPILGRLFSFPQRCHLAPHSTIPWRIWGCRLRGDQVLKGRGQLHEIQTSNCAGFVT
jgi:hypothetical protein